MVFSYLRRLARRLRSRILWPAEVHLKETSARLGSDLQRLETLLLRENDRLRKRLDQLELLLTEHPGVRSQDLEAGARFPSPTVSIVMPTWNRGHGLTAAIKSVQAQTFGDWELLIVDDGSTDDTPEVLTAFEADARIRYVRQTHLGHSAARNHGLRLARGSLIAYLDSDNLWYPDFLAAAVSTFAGNDECACLYGALVSDAHLPAGQRILFEAFDSVLLLESNYIDLNVFVHRKAVVASLGGFDEALTRLADWDLILRYSQNTKVLRVPVLAARYRVLDDKRVTDTADLGVNLWRVRRKWPPHCGSSRKPRVLYVVWHYPQLSETYIEAEIRCMQRWGVHIEVWSQSDVASPYEPSVPVHRGSLTEAIARSQPDILHVHWLSFAVEQRAQLVASNLPLTVRGHGFEVNEHAIRRTLDIPTLRRVFCFPHFAAPFANEPKISSMAAAFDTALFQPVMEKDRQLVVRTGTALPSKDLMLFFEVAKKLPQHRFVMAAITANDREYYPDELREMWRRNGSVGELLFDVPREKLIPLVERAGIYLHTTNVPGTKDAAPVGMPISIAETLATGAYVLVRDLPALTAYVGDAGCAYRDAGHAASLIEETTRWSDARWQNAWQKSVDRAFLHHADEVVLRPLFEEWCSALGEKPALKG